MQVKLFEIRDRMTCIPAMAIRLTAWDGKEEFILRRAGYGKEQLLPESPDPYVILTKLDGLQTEYDPFRWGGGRTMFEAHRFILNSWNILLSGSVVDVEYILNETTAPKVSENHKSTCPTCNRPMVQEVCLEGCGRL